MSTIILKTENRATLIPRLKVRNVVAEVYAESNGSSPKKDIRPLRVTKKISKAPTAKKKRI